MKLLVKVWCYLFPVLMFLVGISGILISGCANLDPLGSPAKDPETGEPDYPTRGGVICRELHGSVNAEAYAQAQGAGFRCLDVGEQAPEGCIQYDDGRFSYTSPGCVEP